MDNTVGLVLVDNDPIYLRLFTKQLERAGLFHPLTHFFTAEAFLSYLWENQGSADTSALLLILDIHMPTMSGIELLKKLQLMPELANRELTIIANSTSSDPDERRQCLELGCIMHHVKSPYNEVLIEAIKSRLQQHSIVG